MGSYRRLDRKHAKRLESYKKMGNKISRLVKWISVLSLMVVLMGSAILSFYIFIDNDNSKINMSVNSSDYVKNSSDSDTNLGYEVSKVKLEGEIKECNNNIYNNKQNNNMESKKYDFSEWNNKCSKEMIVVNKDNPIPEGLTVKTKICRGKEVSVDMYENLDKMISDAKKDGIILWISSGYRSIELQTKLFNRQVEREKNKGATGDEAEKRAQTVVAKPGTSEHNTGLAIDFNGVEDSFYKTKEYEWLIEHAADYGFIERYPKECQDITGVIYEPWHFRYVGVENARMIKESNLCLEDYVNNIQIKK